ncbi:hypothetical protein CsSME_00053552 [Camellia sinensis var. sinensis]
MITISASNLKILRAKPKWETSTTEWLLLLSCIQIVPKGATAVENTVEMDIDNSKFQLHCQHQPPEQHKYCSMSMTVRYHI